MEGLDIELFGLFSHQRHDLPADTSTTMRLNDKEFVHEGITTRELNAETETEGNVANDVIIVLDEPDTPQLRLTKQPT